MTLSPEETQARVKLGATFEDDLWTVLLDGADVGCLDEGGDDVLAYANDGGSESFVNRREAVTWLLAGLDR